MDIYFLGAASFRLKGKTATIIIDPFDPDYTGLKLPKDLNADTVLATHSHQDHNNLSVVTGEPVKITGPGEYEVKGVAIEGVASFHDKQQGAERGRNTIYHISMDGLNIVHLGDLGHTLTQDQIQQIGITDILLVPVGGIYTIDATEATEVVSQLEPKVIIPMHYQLPEMKYELEPLENFLKEMGKEDIEPVGKLSITKDKLPDEPQVVVLSKS
ncbi:MAG: Zn-dependent hydrolase of the beta-lactamase fold-like protein [Candidatus Daviesbacteria bacterium GW2011_GWA2_38_24]|uniref:Zn-dependent hydrolase of the beta-lactamase fold-like protein n=1 Tax=Candidatus Daviesbacteria bacterium GW2011_GWA2_38_24 TaxID=1618422 RepID=A0A0G0JGB0_9BACT|nr:MAG: Zn-dependent hydrolase of the beta-lactamase fold-like protein [Candidatus Daviesbacteria bacterium GW2011_GWA2_38_24]KKQ78323.1 MAG: Zn-dependent hydrolase of the beta-lactamase fold-like protein [Candidatus Daviesbacteria bacterium GW2011_GWA1_38_7]OGE24154.1 MAG: hypothetical protein A2688_00920 [Candidatus Daviesbacteria bacterium RIFCSPHIGHO2_01_FULL_38_8]